MFEEGGQVGEEPAHDNQLLHTALVAPSKKRQRSRDSLLAASPQPKYRSSRSRKGKRVSVSLCATSRQYVSRPWLSSACTSASKFWSKTRKDLLHFSKCILYCWSANLPVARPVRLHFVVYKGPVVHVGPQSANLGAIHEKRARLRDTAMLGPGRVQLLSCFWRSRHAARKTKVRVTATESLTTWAGLPHVAARRQT